MDIRHATEKPRPDAHIPPPPPALPPERSTGDPNKLLVAALLLLILILFIGYQLLTAVGRLVFGVSRNGTEITKETTPPFPSDTPLLRPTEGEAYRTHVFSAYESEDTDTINASISLPAAWSITETYRKEITEPSMLGAICIAYQITVPDRGELTIETDCGQHHAQTGIPLPEDALGLKDLTYTGPGGTTVTRQLASVYDPETASVKYVTADLGDYLQSSQPGQVPDTFENNGWHIGPGYALRLWNGNRPNLPSDTLLVITAVPFAQYDTNEWRQFVKDADNAVSSLSLLLPAEQ